MSSVARPVDVASPRSRSLNPGAAEWAFAALLLLGAVIVFVETRGMSFFGDEWDFVVSRRGLSAHTLLTPHGPHLSLVPILVWKSLLKVFGGSSYVPFRLLASFDIAVVGLMTGVACRARWGRWWSLAPVLLLVTLGPGAATTLWPFQVGYALAVAFGVLALIALDHGWRRADAIACVSLILSLGSGSQGVGFVVGAAILVVLGGNWLRRSWVVLIPALLYAVWYATYGHQYSETHLSAWGASLSYAMQSLSATAGAVVGLSSVAPQTGLLDITFGVPIAVALIVAVAVAAWRGWHPQAIFWGAAATLVVIWLAASLSNVNPVRPPTTPRYVSSNAALVFICLCAATPRPRLTGGGAVAAFLVLAVVSATNADQFGQARASFVAGSQNQRAELGALDLMRGSVSPSYDPGAVDLQLVNIRAGAFFSAQDAFGLVEDTAAQISTQPETTRENVDRILGPNELSLTPAAHVPISGTGHLTVLSGTPRRSRGCLIVGAAALNIAAPPGRIAITTSGSFAATVTAARFATTPIYEVGTIPPGSSATLNAVADLAPAVPWRFTFTGTGSRVCASQ